MARCPENLRLWKEINKKKINDYSKNWAAENRDKRRGYEYAWRDANPEKVKEMNKRGGSKWASSNPDKRNALNAKRRAIFLNATPVWADLKAIETFYTEASRLTKETGIPHEVDHIYPLQGENSCGLHVETNLQVITRFDNRSKKNSYLSGM